MPIMAAQSEHDARLAARLLASNALKHLRNPNGAEDAAVALDNVYRLIDSFDNPFFTVESSAGADAAFSDASSGLNPANLKEVGNVLAEAVAEAFPHMSKDQAVEEIRQVIAHAAYPSEVPKPEIRVIARVIDYFESIAKQLEFA